jgi:hypothetical protein
MAAWEKYFRASDMRLGREVAVKISQEKFTDRFEREARAIAALNHLKRGKRKAQWGWMWPWAQRGYPYDVAADGQRALVAMPIAKAVQPITLVENWAAALKR